MNWNIVEKKNPLALHWVFDSKARAEEFLRDTIPLYCARGYYMDKTLTAESFMVVEDDEQ